MVVVLEERQEERLKVIDQVFLSGEEEENWKKKLKVEELQENLSKGSDLMLEERKK